MTELVHVFYTVSDRAAEVAVAALWQGALVVSALTLCLRLAPRVPAAYRFIVWATAFVALVCLPAFSIVPQFSAGAATAMTEQVAGNATRPWFNLDARWSLVIAALWLAASLFRAVDLAIHSLGLRKLWKDAIPVALDERVDAVLAATSTDFGRGPIEVCTTATLQRPCVIGFFKPRILIPDWLFGRLTLGELKQIVLHEAEHLRRHDDWTNLVQKLCLVLFPLNPALIWIERRLCREREMACDDGVIRVTHAPRAYAACLASLAERGLERRVEALSLGVWHRRPELVHRVHSILRSKGGLSPMGARVLLGALGCGLIAGSVELVKSPQLVVFVPMRSTAAASKIKYPDLTKTKSQSPVQVSKLEVGKSSSLSLHVVPQVSTAPIAPSSETNGEAIMATNVTLREPIRSQKATVPVMAKSETHDAQKAGAENPQWLVLTEWEQVDASSDNAGLRSDYSSGADEVQNTADLATAGPFQGSRITVTQLIFRILPANAAQPARVVAPAHAGSKFGTKPAASSSTSQSSFATFRDGWLVLQL